jgi:hypothetical protein
LSSHFGSTHIGGADGIDLALHGGGLLRHQLSLFHAFDLLWDNNGTMESWAMNLVSEGSTFGQTATTACTLSGHISSTHVSRASGIDLALDGSRLLGHQLSLFHAFDLLKIKVSRLLRESWKDFSKPFAP